jgi:RimJ/RimL family protein N-acetyltransferase
MAETKTFGAAVPGWTPRPRPAMESLTGRTVRLEALDANTHAADLHRAYSADAALWDYLPYGPFASAAEYHAWAKAMEAGPDPLFYVLRDLATGRCGGVASYLRITPEHGTIEVGHINLAPELAQSQVSTEAMFLMMDAAFAAGYRRYEWKCDARNLPSRRAAERYGFSYEGIFRQAAVVKGHNRDTAWFAVTDSDWPALRAAFRTWLDPANFDAKGRQKQRLSDLTGATGRAADPGLQPENP